MFEVAFGGEDHGHVVLIGLVDTELVVLGTAGLDDGGDAGLGGLGYVVGEGEEGIGSHGGALGFFTALANG